jgi:transcriptional regulator with XRE-family HTH domain
MTEETLGMRIRKAREYCGMSQSALARRIKVSKQALYQMESGKTADPGALKIKAIAVELRVNANYLLGLSEEIEGKKVPALAS